MSQTPKHLWTYQELAAIIQCHPRTVARWVKRLNLKIFHPFQTTVRVPDDEAQKLLSQTVRYNQATFPFESHEH
jgi:predicted site-specific integrase-resolvase